MAAAFDRLAPSFDRVAAVAEGTPALLAAERKAALDGLGSDLTRTMAFLQQERIVALRQVTSERIAAIEDLGHSVSTERKALDADIERIGAELVDRAAWRLAQLVFAALSFLVLGTAAILVVVEKLFFSPAGR